MRLVHNAEQLCLPAFYDCRYIVSVAMLTELCNVLNGTKFGGIIIIFLKESSYLTW